MTFSPAAASIIQSYPSLSTSAPDVDGYVMMEGKIA